MTTSGPIQLGGLASGLDTTTIVQQLVAANSGHLQQIQQEAINLRSGAATFSDIGKSLSALQTAAAALSDAQNVSSLTGTSSNAAVSVATDGTAQAGSFNVQVKTLASEQRTYSKSFASSSTALNQTGSIKFQIGTNNQTINIASTDTLQTVASKINASGLRMTASVFYDGTNYRLQVRGLDTGAANKVTFTETGTDFDLNGDGTDPAGGKTFQQAGDSEVYIDGFKVTRPTNQITGAVQGVTFQANQVTTTGNDATVTVATDPSGISTKINAVVSAYNTVISAVHKAAGYGSTPATNPELAGDSSLRTLTNQLSTTLLGSYGTGQFQTLGTIGISLNSDGTLSFDQTKLSNALAKDPTSVQKVLARPSGSLTGGAMATLSDIISNFTASGTGSLSLRQNSFNDQASRLDDDATAEQTRLDQYKDQLTKQFTAMETSYSASQALIQQLTKIG